MLDAIKQAGAGYKLLRMIESFNATLSDEQKALLGDMKTSARGMAATVIPEDVRPIVDYVLADDGDPIIIKAIGAYMHPAVKTTLGQLTAPTTSPSAEGGVTIQCRECGHVAQYGLTEQD